MTKKLNLLGLIGGMSWESTHIYYRALNHEIRDRLGGLHSAPCLLHSVDFAPIAEMLTAGEWEKAGCLLAEIAMRLEKSGAHAILLCTNTMHKVARKIETKISIPLIHIADPTGLAIQSAKLKCVGLLATSFTMEQDFYIARLQDKFGLKVMVPPKPDRDLVHRIIFQELVLGKVYPSSRNEYLRICRDFIDASAEGIILGCTEVGMLLKDGDLPIPFFDTALLHVKAGADIICGHQR